jgi:hypothetical protein
MAAGLGLSATVDAEENTAWVIATKSTKKGIQP